MLAGALMIMWGAVANAQVDAPSIAGASDLKFALEEIATNFRATTRRDVKLVFGSSGNFFRQIEQGAPFQVFMSADEAFVLKLAQNGRLEDRGQLYAIGRIVLFVPQGSSLQIDPHLNGLRAALGAGRLKRFAIANPEHAPYGRAAEEALRKLGLWDGVRPRLVFGENVSQAAQFASSGSADGGIFAYSLALSPHFAKLGRYVLIPDQYHRPLQQRMALMKGAGETARLFYGYLQGPSARAVFRRYGFALPGEQ
ncbi:MAG: molybdate ABC transporter substrate-binding protein [Burkholderiales bacterium]